jgi:hypothetical protein
VHRFVKKGPLSSCFGACCPEGSQGDRGRVGSFHDFDETEGFGNIINMDQTPVPYSFPSNRTLDKKETKTINFRMSTSDTKHATLAASVTASGKLLTPFLISKGKTDGRIASRELQTYPEECIYTCQEKAWMDEAMMNV